MPKGLQGFQKGQHASSKTEFKKGQTSFNKGKSGERSNNWKGGKIIHRGKGGYILVYSPEHPFKWKRAGNYVYEHRLIMEQKIGRFLLPQEKVHHINGIKNDNRPENLALVVKQPHYGIIDCPFCKKQFLIR